MLFLLLFFSLRGDLLSCVLYLVKLASPVHILAFSVKLGRMAFFLKNDDGGE
jgi:hypothetical protein